jgi:hypothetical protein
VSARGELVEPRATGAESANGGAINGGETRFGSSVNGGATG